MSDPFIGEVRIFPFNFAPVGWATCDGQILPISQNTALFSLLGTNYGGNGSSNFSLPNLQDRFVLSAGVGPGLSPRDVGETGGVDQVTLQASQMPVHTHALMATASATGTSPTGAALAPPVNGASAYHLPANTVAMAPGSVGATGASAPHPNRQPALSLLYCIALVGIFPPRA
jgi:microcystin-dependent protein